MCGRWEEAARPVSSVVRESDSERDADYADLAGWKACAAVGNLSAGMEYMRRLDARSVAAGQMAVEEFREMWGTDPPEIFASQVSPRPARRLYGGECAPTDRALREKHGESAPEPSAWITERAPKGE